MKIKDTQNYVILGIFLGFTGLVAALILSFFASITSEPIKQAKMAQENAALKELLPEFDNVPSENSIKIQGVDGTEITFYGAIENDKLVGVCGKGANNKGYAGKIEAMVGLNTNGSIRQIVMKSSKCSAVLITSQNETPGLGSVVCARTRAKTIFTIFEPTPEGMPPNTTLDQFANLMADAAPWQVTKDGGNINYITGATITSRAVTSVIYDIAWTYKKNLEYINSELSKTLPKALTAGDKNGQN